MRMRQKLRALFFVAISLALALALVWLFSVLPYTAAVEPLLPTNWQKFVEFCIDIITPINANITLFLALYVAIFGGGYLAIVKTSKK